MGIIEDNNLILVDSIGMSEGWDWTDMEVYFSKEKNRFYWISGSGCSCNSLWDDIRSLSDFEDGDRKAAASAVRRFAEDSGYGSAGDIATAARTVLMFKG